MRPRLLVLDNSGLPWLFREDRAWFPHFRGADLVRVNVPSGKPIPPLEDFTHLLISGSEASILQPKAWFDREADLIRQAVDRGMPVLGSCFGHQMLVLALSGPDHLARSDPPEVGWAQIERIGSDPLFDELPDPWSTFVFHFGEVIDPPAPWRVLGRTPLCETHVLRYGDRSVWGIQAHPEISSRKARLFLRFTLLLGLRPARQILRALRNVPPRNDVADTIVRRFLEV